jgi:hypothetical protein
VARPPGSSRSDVSVTRQSSSAKAQRGWNRHPAGGVIMLGGEPAMGTSDSRT